MTTTMTIQEFINQVIPTNEISKETSKSDVRRIVANTPIDWDEQEYEQDEVVEELYYNKERYIDVLSDEDVESLKGNWLEYIQDHNSCGDTDATAAAKEFGRKAANMNDEGPTYERAVGELVDYYEYLLANDPAALEPNL